jgi:hypothetical protein
MVNDSPGQSPLVYQLDRRIWVLDLIPDNTDHNNHHFTSDVHSINVIHLIQ